MNARRLLALASACLLSAPLQAQLRVVTYNTLDKPASETDLDDLGLIMAAISQTPRNGITKRPDIVALQEQTTFSLIDSTAVRVADTLNGLFGVESYEAKVLGFGVDRLAVVYDSATVAVGASSGVGTGGPRPVQRSSFTLPKYPESGPLYLYNAHFKAGSASADRLTRSGEATALRSNLAGVGPDVNAIALGDLNIGASSEAAFANLTASGTPSLIDPIALGSWPNSAAAIHMTQSTRTSFLADEGATGGMDDRFDMQLVTQTLLDGEGLSYLGPTSAGSGATEHSYYAFGNDGVSWNTRINNTLLGRSQSAEVINALHDLSDHLPVVADYQLPAVLEVLAGSLPATLTQGEVFELEVVVRNAADVLAAIGADELDYTLSVTGDLTGSFSGSVPALADGDTLGVGLETSTLGQKGGVLTVSTDSQGAANALFELPIAFEVVAPMLLGDFNFDGHVDAADYAVWRDGLAGGGYDQQDYLDWRGNYGNSAATTSSTAPEPSAWMLIAAAAGSLFASGRSASGFFRGPASFGPGSPQLPTGGAPSGRVRRSTGLQ
ncbi:hypothetical protein Pla123a_19100 [Posidoniimonas polymericola]|uniref:Endonuclease/Exonuclease/phosphatase family protein n=1 Tax=Posidoniimonas polymericola TaxID=2528002 RepID=A0A5C5YQW3_9BACT|nr:hypothetical protein [Posidoniimonas polymericola]TWT77253.1 hypothetical protein Pla123a_19100 [Posidoniimonas polymericola]